MSLIPENVSIRNASEATSKWMTDAQNKQLCAGNKVSYRFVRTNAAAGVTTYGGLIRLRPPCCYLVTIRWSMMSTGGNIGVITTYYQINQASPGAPINVPGGVVPGGGFNSQTPPATSKVEFIKTVGVDSLDVTVTTSGMVGLVSDVLEIDVFSNKLF